MPLGDASANPNTIRYGTELEDYLDNRVRPAAAGQLRQDLHDRIAEFAIHWFRRGFGRGCKETHAAYVRTRTFPRTVSYEAARTFYASGKRPVKMRWAASKKKSGKKADK